MDKSRKKKTFYNKEILNRLIKKYGLTERFITMSISGDRVSETSEKIKTDYNLMVKAVDETLKGL